MEKQDVIPGKFLQTKLPIVGTVVLFLLLDRLGLQGWLWGVCLTLTVLYWIGAIILIAKSKHRTPLFSVEGKDKEKSVKSILDSYRFNKGTSKDESVM